MLRHLKSLQLHFTPEEIHAETGISEVMQGFIRRGGPPVQGYPEKLSKMYHERVAMKNPGDVHIDISDTHNPPRKRFVKPYRVETWSERGEFTITVYDANDEEILSWDTEGVNDMVESGYFDASGFSMGREVRPGRLENSVLKYIEEMGIDKARKNPPLPASALMDLGTGVSVVSEILGGARPIQELTEAKPLLVRGLSKLRASHQGQIDFANPPPKGSKLFVGVTDKRSGERWIVEEFRSLHTPSKSTYPEYTHVIGPFASKKALQDWFVKRRGRYTFHGVKHNPVTTSGYDRSKHPEQIHYREMTLAEAKVLRYGDHPKVLDRNGRLRDVKVNGALKVWKTRPGDVDVPLKYGMYEYLTASFRDGKSDGLLVVVEDEPGEQTNPPAIDTGDTVKYSRAFLQSTGMLTGPVPFATGKVIGMKQLGKGGLILAAIKWDTPDLPEWVNVKNLVLKSRLHLEPNPPATLIYKDIVEIRAIKPNGDRYVHKFGKGSSIFGLPDGDILIRSRKGKRLWKNFKMEG